LFFILFALPMIAQTAPSASTVLNDFLDRIDRQTLSTSFTITVTDDGSQPMSYNGKIQMRDTCFTLSMFGSQGAYDGKTYYLYSEDTDELTLTNPTRDELLEANPILFARELGKLSTVRFSGTNRNPKIYAIDLIPDNRSAGIQRFTIKIDKSTFLPKEISVREGKQLTTLLFPDARFVSAVPVFTISKPGAFVNDLR